jgi:hypothetical protein
LGCVAVLLCVWLWLQGVQVLMELRRQFMQQAQWQWWEN